MLNLREDANHMGFRPMVPKGGYQALTSIRPFYIHPVTIYHPARFWRA
jgi:hypothetical protein